MNKPPSPTLSTFRQLQKSTMEFVDRASDAAGLVSREAADKLRDIDNAHGLTEGVAKAGKRIQDVANGIGDRYDIADRATKVIRATTDGVEKAAAVVKQTADDSGITQAMRSNIVDPILRGSRAAGSSDALRKTMAVAEGVYGEARRVVKDVVVPVLPTYDSKDLLQVTKRELNYIAACILQVSTEESSQIGSQFGKAVTAKIAGAASTTALLGIIATFGQAGTGAAISGLSGAAATSATMAWVGSLVGGGVAAGAALTGGLALVVGLGAYRLLGSERRAFETLSPLEQRIVQSCWMLGSVADAYQEKPHEFTVDAAVQLLEKALVPLHRDIETNIVALCEPLDGKHAVAMRQHVLVDFRSAVIERFGVYLSWAYSDEGRAWQANLLVAAPAPTPHARAKEKVDEEGIDPLNILRKGNAEAAIGGVFSALHTRTPLDGSTESRLVLEALRRSTISLRDASEGELGDYLNELEPAAWKGVASNVKGIYHELLYVEQYNATHDDSFARIFEATNHPGVDVQIYATDTGEVLKVVQLKAVESAAAVNEHLERYPDIPVAVTDEVEIKFDDARVKSSGFSNDTLREDANAHLGGLRDNSIDARVENTALIALGIASTAELVQMLRGEREFPEAVMNTAVKVGAAAGATALTALLFG
ncbi:MAG: hypothetical protein RLY71_2179 [Pseudomonadota bacterium]|jgi:hypothetical protein